MTINERIAELNTELRIENAKDAYYAAELELVDLVGNYVTNRAVNCQAYGTGKIVSYRGTALDNIIVAVEFVEQTKQFSLQHIIEVARFIKFVDHVEIEIIWTDAKVVHDELTKQLKTIENLERQQAFEAKKKAEADKLAEKKYETTKAKAIRDFENLVKAEMPMSTADEFYYSLGWLAKHVGSVSARLPDYLSDSFVRHFGTDAVHTSVDSKKRTINGNSMQWTFGFTATLRKPENIPSALTEHLGSTGKQIADTSFIWDLVDNYGFQFGKKQDVDKIRSHVPSDFLTFFEAGLA